MCIHGNTYTLKLTGTKFVKEKEHFSSFLQLWSSSVFIQSVVQGLFGVDPKPRNNRFTINPHMPDDWEFAELKNLRIFDKFYDISMKRKDGETTTDIKDCTERNVKQQYSSFVQHE
jgi:cellobiose phosphorylase